MPAAHAAQLAQCSRRQACRCCSCVCCALSKIFSAGHRYSASNSRKRAVLAACCSATGHKLAHNGATLDFWVKRPCTNKKPETAIRYHENGRSLKG